MGNLNSTVVDAIIEQVTIPMRREPIPEGASGLHYPAGRIYGAQAPMSSDFCNGATVAIDKINEIMPDSISTTLEGKEAIRAYAQGLMAPGATIDKQMLDDKAFYARMKKEYCFYETRYITALRHFVTTVAESRGMDSGSPVLKSTVNLNKRLNSLLEIMDYVSNERSKKVNDRSKEITAANAALQEKIKTLKNQQEFLESADVRIRTQEEMVRYSAEKSRAMNIQIMFFVALNVIALGTIVTVYNGVKGSGI